MVEISISLEQQDKDYAKAMVKASCDIERLTFVLIRAEFENDNIEMTNTYSGPYYESAQERNGHYKKVFQGYQVIYCIKLKLDFDMKRLSGILYTLFCCIVGLDISLSFTVKNAIAVNEEMLHTATVNARKKATLLCEAAEVTLGRLISIDYDWIDLNVHSNTEVRYRTGAYDSPVDALTPKFLPEDIKLSDSATFMWEID